VVSLFEPKVIPFEISQECLYAKSLIRINGIRVIMNLNFTIIVSVVPPKKARTRAQIPYIKRMDYELIGSGERQTVMNLMFNIWIDDISASANFTYKIAGVIIATSDDTPFRYSVVHTREAEVQSSEREDEDSAENEVSVLLSQPASVLSAEVKRQLET
jgi:hypothetical protein